MVMPAIKHAEGDPHDALARVALGDQQRELAEVGEPDRQVQALRHLDVAAVEVDRRVGLDDRLAVRRGPDDLVRAATRTVPVPSAARSSSSLSPMSRPGMPIEA